MDCIGATSAGGYREVGTGMPGTVAGCPAEFEPQISNAWFSHRSISHDVILVFLFFFHFLLKPVNLSDNHAYPCASHLLLPPEDPRMTLNFWSGIHLLRAEITMCWGSNSGLCACQASTLPTATFFSPERFIFVGGGFEMVRVMHVPPAPTLLLIPPRCNSSIIMHLANWDTQYPVREDCGFLNGTGKLLR